MINVQNLKKTYSERTVLDVESLTVETGETVALIGANGCGKTTLLRILAGQVKPTTGKTETETPVLFLPQKCYPFRGTVLDNVLLGAKDKKNEAKALLERLELTELMEKKAASLSGGELQRLSLCRLLIRPCRLLLLDEPTSACDAYSTALLLDALKDYQKTTGCTVLFSTHAPGVAARTGERLLFMSEGKIVADGAPADVLEHPSSPWLQSFLNEWRI